MDLIILESPNKVRDVQKYAEAAGFPAKVTATLGHMVDLPSMREGVCVDTARFVPERVVPCKEGAAERINRLRADIARAARVIVATDPDREGEAIAAQVWQWIPAGRAYRATFEEITQPGVERGLRAMRRALKIEAVEAAHRPFKPRFSPGDAPGLSDKKYSVNFSGMVSYAHDPGKCPGAGEFNDPTPFRAPPRRSPPRAS